MRDRKKSSKSQVVGSLIIGGLALIFIIRLSVDFSNDSTSSSDDLPYYSVYNSSAYVRDGMECRAYRVSVPEGATQSEMKQIYKAVIKGDGYYLHTVWFYSSREKASNAGYDVGMIEETSVGRTSFSAP